MTTGNKVCSTCREAKPVMEFHRHKGKRDGRQPVCKACKIVYNATYYMQNAARHKHLRDVHRQRLRRQVDAMIQAVKSLPCADCGQRFPTVAMDLDHVQGQKVADSTGIRRMGRGSAEKEISKCEAVCVNCHRRRTALRIRRANMLSITGWVPRDSNPKPAA